MKIRYDLVMIGLLLPLGPVFAAGGDDPLLTKLMVDQLEKRENDKGDEYVFDGELWIGKDLNKFWLKAKAEQFDGETESSEVQALYSRAVAPYWDLQLGVRRDAQPEPKRNWAVIGFNGLAPYFFEIDTALFIGEQGRSAARFMAEYEIMFTQRLVLTPEVEFNLYGKDDPQIGIGSGLADMEAGLRLSYAFTREFAPYIGINWSGKFGKTADYARDAGEETAKTQWVAGVRMWF